MVEVRRNDDEGRARTALTELAQNRSDAMLLYYDEVRAVLAAAAGSPAIRDVSEGPTTGGTQRAARVQLDNLQSSLDGQAVSAAVVNPYGDTVMLRGRRGPLRPSDAPVTPSVRLSIPDEFGGVSTTGPYISRVTRTPVIAFAMLTGSQDTAFIMVEVPMVRVLNALTGQGAPARLRLIDRRRDLVVADSRTGVRWQPVPPELDAALASNQAVGTTVSGRALTAFQSPSLLGLNLSGAVGGWIITATDSSALPTLIGAVGAGSWILVLGGLIVFSVAAIGLRSSARRLERLADTDMLTNLGNRRRLLSELEVRLRDGSAHLLVLLDLNGFKAYNDAFGHAAGDSLLRRLSGRLQSAAGDHDASAYRLGGDEFCVLARTGSADEVGSWAGAALTEDGQGFAVSASWGVAHIPDEVDTAAEALRIADERMYLQKAAGRASPGRQVTDVVVSLLNEHDPGRHASLHDLADLTEDIGIQVGLSEQDRSCVRRATLLHRVGLLAVPSAILNKAEPLTPDERDFIRTNTLVATRVLSAAPSLRAEMRIVRATSECFDGSGHPDGLSGEAIPLASRVISVAAAYAALTEGRPYRTAVSHSDALAEVRRCAGGQFDPRVVDALSYVLHMRIADAQGSSERLSAERSAKHSIASRSPARA